MCKKCKVSECPNDVAKGGFCNKHYIRNRRYGDPLKTKSGRREPGTRTEEDDRESKRRDYQKNKEKYAMRAEKWRIENEERYRFSKKEYLEKEEVKKAAIIRSAKWRTENLERKRRSDKNWRANNVDKKRSYQAFRRAKVKEATPPWLTKEHRHQIALIYKEALRLSRENSVMYHVDHIVPLAGKNVSGLHVPWNLRAIPAAENHRKSNKLTLD